jgi:hypothetical protein
VVAAPGGLTARAGRGSATAGPAGTAGHDLSPDAGVPTGAPASGLSERGIDAAAGRHRAAAAVGTAGVRAGRAGGGRVARALAAVGVTCLLGGATLFAAGPAPAVAALGPVAADRALVPAPAAPVDPLLRRALPVGVDGEIVRLLAGGLPAPIPVRAGTPPVELALPGREVRAPVVAVSTGPAGALLVPEPPSTVGWWSPSALPGGTAGTTVLAGHVDSAAGGLGALAVLRDVAAGEEVVLHGADGRAVGYRVTARRQYAKADLPPEVFAVGGPARLVLITCGGAFDRRARHYADNVVVFAEPVTAMDGARASAQPR